MLPLKLWRHTNHKLFLALAGIIAVAIAATTSLIVTTTDLIHSRQQAQQYINSRMHLVRLLSDLEQAESYRNAYALDPDQTYLDAFRTAAGPVPTEIKWLVSQSAGTSYHPSIVKLEPLVLDRLDRMNTSVELVRSGQSDAALAIFKSGQGLQLMQEIRPQIADIQKQQVAILSQAGKYQDLLTAICLYIAVGTLVLTMGLALVTARLSQQAVESERQLDRAKDDFLALAAHQLRTPASGIRAILQSLKSGDLGPLNHRQNHFVARAIESNVREINIIEELLDVAQADAGRLLMRPTDFNLCALVESVVEEQRPHIEQKGIKLEVHQPLQPVNVHADQGKLQMAISNLLDNARKYTSAEGHIDVSVRSNNTQVTVEVADTGVGLEPADAARLFDRFQRGPTLLASAVPGTGLGLYLARQVAELHEGTITVKSKKGQGSRFKIQLPAGRPHAA